MNKDYWREMFSYTSLYSKLAKVKKTIVPKEVSFGVDKEQYFLHFTPEQCKNDKIIVWIHGGGWNSGNPKFFDFVGQCFAKAGYHCVSLGYRLSPKNKYPCQIEDVCAGYNKAMEYLSSIALDTSKVIVTGPSAGAHLSSILCYDKAVQEKYNVKTDNIIGFIGVAGPYIIQTNHIMTVKELFRQLFAKGYDRTLAEPISVIENTNIPMLLIQSRHDGLFDYSIAEKFYDKAKSLGIECELYEVVDKMNTHSSYSAGMFLESRDNNQALDKLFSWIEMI